MLLFDLLGISSEASKCEDIPRRIEGKLSLNSGAAPFPKAFVWQPKKRARVILGSKTSSELQVLSSSPARHS